jgi:hypothetical protein
VIVSKIIKLTSEAKITGHTFDNGYFEMSAQAVDDKGKECVVYWVFEETEGRELDDYDYDKIDRIEYYLV